MTMTRFVPFGNDMMTLQNRLNSIFHEFARPESGSEALAAGNFVPAVDVYEDQQKLVLRLEVPGIPKDALDIRVEGRTLTVRGERGFNREEKEENFQRIERRYGRFERSFALPTTVDSDSIEAEAADGVLTLTLARKPEAKPKQIAVKGAPSASASKQTFQGQTTGGQSFDGHATEQQQIAA